jgi:hypothetical protein
MMLYVFIYAPRLPPHPLRGYSVVLLRSGMAVLPRIGKLATKIRKKTMQSTKRMIFLAGREKKGGRRPTPCPSLRGRGEYKPAC